jgi:hypothetical protein
LCVNFFSTRKKNLRLVTQNTKEWKAIKMRLLDAYQLYPTTKCQEKIERLQSSNHTNKPVPEKKVESTESPTTSHQDVRSEMQYTQEQVEQVQRILKCKDYYEVLTVSRDATETEIRSKYKKVTLVAIIFVPIIT